MSNGALPEVFSPAELAHAALVEPGAVHALIAAGEVSVVPHTSYVAVSEALRVGRALREAMLLAPTAGPDALFAGVTEHDHPWTAGDGIRVGIATAYVVVLAVMATWGEPRSAPLPIDEAARGARLVFVVAPGPGGGGGGGGTRDQRLVTRARERV